MSKPVVSPARCVALLTLFLAASWNVSAAQSSNSQGQNTPAPPPGAQAIIPRLIRFNGALRDISGKPLSGPVDVTFSLYADEAGNSPLWFETQTVQADSRGNYTVLLGAMSPAGVPMELFTEGQAHWLGVQVANLPEQSRVLLVSVPYAMKAGDAESLGGKPASAYLLSSQADAHAANAAALSSMITKGSTTTTSESPVTNTITSSYIPVFTDSIGTTANSIMFQSGTKIGINTNAPAVNLDLNGPVFMVGTKTAAAGQGGTMRFRDDSGTQRWLFGIPGSGGSQDFQMYNYTNGHAPIFVQNGAASYSLYLAGTGNVGVGTTTPAQKLSVAGVIQSTTGGFKFPDGSTQTTAATGGGGGGGTATDLNCGSCVASTEVSFNYAGSSSKGGAATNSLALGGVAASGYATLGSNSFTGDQVITGNLTVSTDEHVVGNLTLDGLVNGWKIVPYTSSSCTVFGTSGTCESSNVLGGYTGFGKLSAMSKNATEKPITSSVSGANVITAGVVGGTISGGGGAVNGGSFSSSVDNNWGTVAGGAHNTTGDGTGPTSVKCCQTIGGGYWNQSSAQGTTVAGGFFNIASGSMATVSGGYNHVASGNNSTIAGGTNNTASGNIATVAGGNLNTASGNYSATIGGQANNATGQSSFVAAGENNTASGQFSFAGGCQAYADTHGSFVWSGFNGTSCAILQASANSSGANGQFLALAPGGVKFFTSSLLNAGVGISAGGGSWSNLSDRNSKQGFESVDGASLLARLNEIPMSTWSYKTQDPSIRHMGPMAQDLYAAFHLGEDERHITDIDGQGVALAGVQALYRRDLEKDAKIKEQQQQIIALQAESTEKAAQIDAMAREIELLKAQAAAVAALEARVKRVEAQQVAAKEGAGRTAQPGK